FTPPTTAYSGFTGGSVNQVYDSANDLYRPSVTGGTSDNMTLVSVANPANGAARVLGRMLLQLDTSLAVTPNVDFTAEVSRDGGTTFAAANLQLVSTLGSIKTYDDPAIDMSGLPAGSSMVWRAKTLTNKDIALTGVA